MTIERAVRKLLRKHQGPMHVDDITKEIMDREYWRPKAGNRNNYDPRRSVSNCLNKKLEDPQNCPWERVGKKGDGRYQWKDKTQVGGPRRRPSARRPPRNRPQTNCYPDERHLREGARKQVLVNKYERSAPARQRCIEKYGEKCCVCHFSFKKTYGIDQELIHVHHVRPLSTVGDRRPDPVRDLRPVCPNCHAVIHSRKGNRPFCIEEVQAFFARD